MQLSEVDIISKKSIIIKSYIIHIICKQSLICLDLGIIRVMIKVQTQQNMEGKYIFTHIIRVHVTTTKTLF